MANIDISIPHTVRVWNYWLGGKDNNFRVDRAVGDQIQAMVPDVVASARADRAFLGRVVRYLVSEAGVRQFVNIGAGLPTVDNTHEVAQAAESSCRIPYVDNDPLVLSHAHALATSGSEGRVEYRAADAQDVEVIIRRARQLLDFDLPIAVMLLGILNFIDDDNDAVAIVNGLTHAVPAGSFLVLAHPTKEVNPEAAEKARQLWNESATLPLPFRNREQLVTFFAGLDLFSPSVVSCPRWRPEPDAGPINNVYQFCAVGQKS
jgi:O-methyltransferase involved in polyketide biosynthesis